MRRPWISLAALGCLCAASGRSAIVPADPSTYQGLLPALQPGDTMVLAPGSYTQGLTINGMNGLPGLPIVVTGPGSGPPAVFLGRSCCNTVSISDASYVEIRSLTLDGQGLLVDAVKAEGSASFAHHITLEGLTIVNHGADQQIVGINTKCPTWGFIIRRNTITGAGTGMYLGDSNGTAPFVDGLIEHNLVRDTVGYNLQVKHQLSRPSFPTMPQSARTVIRHNVFGKAQGGATGANARPNVLVGHWPLTGSGSGDVYEIYGNFFYANPTEALFQGEGNVALYENLFVNPSGPAIHVQPHYDVPRTIRIFHNTVVASAEGISVSGGDPGFTQEVTGNGSFGNPALSGGTQVDNVAGTQASAPTYLVNPLAPPGTLDLYPRVGTMTGSIINPASINGFTEWNVDFNGRVHDGRFRGAYAGEGVNPGWLPVIAPMPFDAEPFLVGQGLGPTSPNRVRVFYATGAPAPVDFLAYTPGAWGVIPAAGNLDGGPYGEIVTGPGPGAVFGPQVRGFLRDAAPMAKVNFYAYGTLRYGVGPAAGSIDADAFDEILTGPGPGAVFGPHVRGFNVDGATATPISKVSFFAYGTLKFGVNASAGGVDGDAFHEILTGPGPGVIFGPQVRGFDYDGAAVTAIAKINFNAFAVLQYGCHLDGGDVDADGFAEIAVAPGPAATLPARFLGFNYDGTAIAALPGFDATPYPTFYGGRVGLGNAIPGPPVKDDLVAGAGRDPAAGSSVVAFSYTGAALVSGRYGFTPFTGGYGVNATSGALGW